MISTTEMKKLQFNELPLLQSSRDRHSESICNKENQTNCNMIGLEQWSDLRSLPSSRLSPLWDRANVRLPVYVYGDLVSSFIKSCENYQLQLDEDSIRIRSKSTIASAFFKKYLSADPSDQISNNLRSALPLEALREVVEAVFLYIGRYFSSGASAVDSIERLWGWVSSKPSRLTYFSLLALQQLREAIILLLTDAQTTNDVTESEEAREQMIQTHQAIKQVFFSVSAQRDRPPGSAQWCKVMNDYDIRHTQTGD